MRERIAPNLLTSGLSSQGVTQHLQPLQLAWLAPNETKRSTIKRLKMAEFSQFIAAMVAAGAFGVAVVQTAMTEPLQQHSGTQQAVRIIK